MISRVALALILLTAGCATYPAAKVDFLGNVYPPQCADLSDIHVPIIETDNVILWKKGGDAHLFGGLTKSHVILIRKGLTPTIRAEVIRHEKCHEKMFRVTGSPDWH